MKLFAEFLIALFLLIAGIWLAGSQPIFLLPEKVDTPEVDPKTLEANVRFLSEVLPKRIGTEINLAPTVDWIEKKLKPYSAELNEKVYRQSYQVKDEIFHNILLEFEPNSNKEDEELIVIGAHYDSAHGFAGADDNASGVAALIELARLLSQHKNTLSHRVVLAFYPLEEPPYFRTNKMGSFVHAARLKENKQKVKLMISLDMVGYFTDEENSQHLPFPFMDMVYPTQGNFIALVSNLSNMLSVRKVKKHFKSATDLPVHSFNAPAFVEGIDFSDHLNFWYHDYPALMITDTSFNRYKYYHTVEDTAEKLDYVKMAEVVKALYQTVLKLSEN